MKTNKHLNNIPAFYIYFGVAALTLFCVCAALLIVGIYQKAFLINPIYLFMLTIGFLGLLTTDIVAIAEWKKAGESKGE